MKFVLTTPLNTGSFEHPIVVDELEITSIAINFDPTYTKDSQAAISIMLMHKASGWQKNIMYTAPSVLTLWNSLNGGDAITSAVLSQLVADGKLPAGEIVS